MKRNVILIVVFFLLIIFVLFFIMINKSNNDYGIADIDSEAGNKKDGEDDISKAEVIISIRTGAVAMYIGLIFAVIVIIAVGVYFINKKVLNREERF